MAQRPKIICPAEILATSRNLKVKGRIRRLIVSINTKNGARTIGEPLGTRALIKSLNLRVIFLKRGKRNIINPSKRINEYLVEYP